MRSLNLLQHPSLTRKQKTLHSVWTNLAGLAIGGLCVAAWLQWHDAETVRLRHTQADLQARWLLRTQQNQAVAKSQIQSREQVEHWQQWQRIEQHQQLWVRWHEDLLAEARRSGLQLVRLQADAMQIELQGTTLRTDAMSETRQRLSEPLEHPLQLVSMTADPHAGMGFVWQAPWPAAPGLPVLPRLPALPGSSLGPSPRGKP